MPTFVRPTTAVRHVPTPLSLGHSLPRTGTSSTSILRHPTWCRTCPNRSTCGSPMASWSSGPLTAVRVLPFRAMTWNASVTMERAMMTSEKKKVQIIPHTGHCAALKCLSQVSLTLAVLWLFFFYKATLVTATRTDPRRDERASRCIVACKRTSS